MSRSLSVIDVSISSNITYTTTHRAHCRCIGAVACSAMQCSCAAQFASQCSVTGKRSLRLGSSAQLQTHYNDKFSAMAQQRKWHEAQHTAANPAHTATRTNSKPKQRHSAGTPWGLCLGWGRSRAHAFDCTTTTHCEQTAHTPQHTHLTALSQADGTSHTHTHLTALLKQQRHRNAGKCRESVTPDLS